MIILEDLPDFSGIKGTAVDPYFIEDPVGLTGYREFHIASHPPEAFRMTHASPVPLHLALLSVYV
jgi:hypothetical protein